MEGEGLGDHGENAKDVLPRSAGSKNAKVFSPSILKLGSSEVSGRY